MSEIVVYPEQISFDVRQQRTNKRVRVTIKNMGINAIKLNIRPPRSDSFIITNSKGSTISSDITFNMLPESSQYVFVQKKSTVGIVPDDSISIDFSGRSIKVCLRPAVSLVSVDELEAVANMSEKAPESARSLDSMNLITKNNVDLVEIEKKVSKIPSRSNFISKMPINESADIEASQEEDAIERPKSKPETIKSCSKFPMPELISIEPESLPIAKSSIPKRVHHSNLPYSPDIDVLEQSLSFKLNTSEPISLSQNEDSRTNEPIVNWYEENAFDDIEEPEFSFELMLVKEGEDPIFCIDGDYYDSSGTLLVVQQGKAKKVFVTEQYEKLEDDVC